MSVELDFEYDAVKDSIEVKFYVDDIMDDGENSSFIIPGLFNINRRVVSETTTIVIHSVEKFFETPDDVLEKTDLYNIPEIDVSYLKELIANHIEELGHES